MTGRAETAAVFLKRAMRKLEDESSDVATFDQLMRLAAAHTRLAAVERGLPPCLGHESESETPQ